MKEWLDDEFQQMNERESSQDLEIVEAISVKDPVSSLDLQKMAVVEAGTPVATVVNLFQSERIPCVLVVKAGKLAGIFTERDLILKLSGKGLDHSTEIVDDYMTENPDVLRMGDPIAFALNRMTDGGYRHIPLVDDRGRPVGLVGILDIVKHLAFYYSEEVLNLPPEPPRRAQKRPEGG